MSRRSNTSFTGFLFFLFSFFSRAVAQENVILSDTSSEIINARRMRAMALIDREDTITPSLIWPNIKPSLFFANIRQNIIYPSRINQGKSTNFCGYAALTHLLLKYKPEVYTREVLSLYHTGKVDLQKHQIKPRKEVLHAAGTLKNKGELDILHADQLWFLALADQFKGYLNIFDHKYNPGDENKIWAGTNYAKFNKMVKSFTSYKLVAAGSDFLRPLKNDFYEYITQQMQTGIVWLYINSKFLYPHTYSFFKLRAPTHFVVLYEMYKVGEMIQIKYWDYGLKTEQLITKKRLKKLIFGVTTITK